MIAASNTAIARTLIARLQAGESSKEVSTKLAAFLIDERRQGDTRSIIRDVERRMLLEFGVLYVHATTAHSLSSDQIEQIKTIFSRSSTKTIKEIRVEETIDKNVIGGVRCETADTRLDLTVRRQLQQLKNQAM